MGDHMQQLSLIPPHEWPIALRDEPRGELETVAAIMDRQYNTWRLSKDEIERAMALLEQFRRRVWGT